MCACVQLWHAATASSLSTCHNSTPVHTTFQTLLSTIYANNTCNPHCDPTPATNIYTCSSVGTLHTHNPPAKPTTHTPTLHKNRRRDMHSATTVTSLSAAVKYS